MAYQDNQPAVLVRRRHHHSKRKRDNVSNYVLFELANTLLSQAILDNAGDVGLTITDEIVLTCGPYKIRVIIDNTEA